MEQLLARYSLTEIIIFLVLIGCAIKEVITFLDWAHKRLKQRFAREDEHEEIKKELEKVGNHLDNIEKHFTTMIEENRIQSREMQASIDLLIASDKDDIKAWITREHHFFCYEAKKIDDYSLDCIEKRYSHYRDEGGNSYVADLIAEIRELPKVSSVNVKHHNQEGAIDYAKNQR